MGVEAEGAGGQEGGDLSRRSAEIRTAPASSPVFFGHAYAPNRVPHILNSTNIDKDYGPWGIVVFLWAKCEAARLRALRRTHSLLLFGRNAPWMLRW